MIGVKSFIGKESVKAQSFNQGWRTNNLAALTGMQGETNEIAQRIRQRQHFRR